MYGFLDHIFKLQRLKAESQSVCLRPGEFKEILQDGR
jgi:hypothetical protein